MNTWNTHGKRVLAALIVLCSWFGVWPTAAVQWEYEETKEVYRNETFSDSELSETILAVEGYIYSRPPSRESIKLFDIQKNKHVVLTFKAFHRRDFRDVGNRNIALCADFEANDGDDYMIWFVVGQKGTKDRIIEGGYYAEIPPSDRMIVKDAYIHMVNGKERFRWEEKDGIWSIRHLPAQDKDQSSEHHH